MNATLLNHKGEACCPVCEQSASYPGWWGWIPSESDPTKQDVGFVDCDRCLTKHVCGDCHCNGECCAERGVVPGNDRIDLDPIATGLFGGAQ